MHVIIETFPERITDEMKKTFPELKSVVKLRNEYDVQFYHAHYWELLWGQFTSWIVYLIYPSFKETDFVKTTLIGL